jgi:apolipoprotein N-acyltransferase
MKGVGPYVPVKSSNSEVSYVDAGMVGAILLLLVTLAVTAGHALSGGYLSKIIGFLLLAIIALIQLWIGFNIIDFNDFTLVSLCASTLAVTLIIPAYLLAFALRRRLHDRSKHIGHMQNKKIHV